MLAHAKRPLGVSFEGRDYIVQADASVYLRQTHEKPEPGKPGYVRQSFTVRRVKDEVVADRIRATLLRAVEGSG